MPDGEFAKGDTIRITGPAASAVSEVNHIEELRAGCTQELKSIIPGCLTVMLVNPLKYKYAVEATVQKMQMREYTMSSSFEVAEPVENQ